ncbi:tripartite tricarboxylate transporter substrate binding protein [Variovorax rhizosphaerae]|uniref:Tripartite tricarboxylate transporter substrate binding protein n=1 Tax=Variovorax rhizosphaerae TaxID=1836200 RepID=A0ABU8WT19_9BURK
MTRFPTRRDMLLSAAALSLGAAHAQDAWPSRPVRLVVPFPPGGGSDTLSRHIVGKLSAQKGWTFIVDNKPGAGGNVGLDQVAKAKPDGYTLGMGQTANLAINPTLYRAMPFDAARDFTPISMVATQPLIFIVRSESRFKTLADLVKTARERPDTVTMASAGNGTAGHLTGEYLARQANVRFSHVPYKGFGQAMTDLLGGQVDFLATSPQSCIGQMRAGKVRALGVTSLKRMELFPQVPSLDELGYTGFEAAEWKVLLGPAGMPADIVRQIHAQVQKALTAPDLIETLASEGATPMSSTPESTRAFILAEQRRWGAVVKQSGAVVD